MAQVTKEVKGTGAARDSLIGNDVRIRRFHVNAATEGNTWQPQDALDASLIPKVGDAHPDRPELLCHEVSADLIDGAVRLAFVEAVYAIPRGTIIGLPADWYRVRFTQQTGTTFAMVGIDGKPIGTPYVYRESDLVQLTAPDGKTWAIDPNAELGTNVFVTEWFAEVILPVPSTFNLNVIFSDKPPVNDRDYVIGPYTFPKGRVQLLGAIADEVGPNAGDCAVTLNYRIGTTVLDFGSEGTVTIDLAHTYDFPSVSDDWENKGGVITLKEKATIRPAKKPRLEQVYPYKELPVLPARP